MSYTNATELPDRLWSAWQPFQSHSTLLAIALTIIFFVRGKVSEIIAAWPFITRRDEYMKAHNERVKGKTAEFKVLHHSIAAVKGADARKAFYDDKNLNFIQGYLTFNGGSPRIDQIDVKHDGDDNALFAKRMATILRKDRLGDVVTTLFDDMQIRMAAWGKEGTLDPFKSIYDVVFQMTVSMASCHEFASDISAITKFQHQFWLLEHKASTLSILFPKLPLPAKRAKEASVKYLFMTLWHYVEQRKKAPVPSSDTIDLLLGQGLKNEDIIQFMLAFIFAGIVNTGINACWILLYISIYPKWKNDIHTEVSALLAQYSNASDPLHKRLSAIPISFWEDATPTLDLAIRETVRITVNFTAMRRHIPGPGGPDLKIPGAPDVVVHNDGFLLYNMSDVHMNPDIYPDPTTFDPERYKPGREEDKREHYGYLGWGAGRHPCLGMKIATLEMKMIVAQFVLGYEYDVVDAKGRVLTRPPLVDYNAQLQAKPMEPCFIKYKRIVE